MAEVARETPIDAADLPAYAGRLFDGFQARPQVLRLATWYELEHGPSVDIPEPGARNNQHKAAAIAKAQAAPLRSGGRPAAGVARQLHFVNHVRARA